jgi:hypothetical protein
MLRGALAFFRGASYSVKSRDPIQKTDRMVDFAMAWRGVNATNKNKTVLIEREAFGRIISHRRAAPGNNVFAHLRR